MILYLLVLLTEMAVWWRLKNDFRDDSLKRWHIVKYLKLVFTLILIYSFTRVLFIRGEMGTPQSASLLIFFGAVAAMNVTSNLLYIILSLIRLGLSAILNKKINWLKWTYSVLSIMTALLFVYGFFLGRFNIKTEKRDIYVKCADSRVDGLKIAFISDLHLSSFFHHYDKLSSVVSEINMNRPDLMINGGDFITYGWKEFNYCDTILRKVRARYGSFAVRGNHDDCSYDRAIDLGARSDGSLLVDSLIKASDYVLLNDTSKTFNYNGAMVTVAGIRTSGHRLNISYGDETKALSGISDSSLVIFIVHDPAFWSEYNKLKSFASLTLSGHTHGMQIGIPTHEGYWSPASFIHPYPEGLYKQDDHYLYVNRGLGTMAMAIRIFMPPEITIITLHCQ